MNRKKIIPLFLAVFVCLVLIGYGFSEWIFIGDVKESYHEISGGLTMAEVVPMNFTINTKHDDYNLTIDQNDQNETYAINNGEIDCRFTPSKEFEFVNRPLIWRNTIFFGWTSSNNTTREFEAYEIEVTLLNENLKDCLRAIIKVNDEEVSNPFIKDIEDQEHITDVTNMQETNIDFTLSFEWISKERVIDNVSSKDDYNQLISTLNATQNADLTYSFNLNISIKVTTI